jgi:DNA-binding HxlR family transcriptional regulator/putative sterol carrier protein
MAHRHYGQYCGFARALEVIGERWSLLIVRDLLVAPARFTDLHRGLPGIPTSGLTARLKELEEADVVRRRVTPRPDRSVVYEMTEYGRELEGIVDSIGRWGAKSLGDPRPEEIATAASLLSALRATFRADAASGLRATYEIRFGEIVIHARIEDGVLTAAEGAARSPDLTIEATPAIRSLMAGELTPTAALETGALTITGDPHLLDTFAKLFRIDRKPVAA